MISINFSGTVAEVLAEMEALVAAHGVSPIDAAPAEPPAKPATRGKKTDKTSAEGNAVGTAESASTTSATSTAVTAETSPSETPSRDDIAKKAVTYGQPGKGGPAALKELFVQHGSANGKWSEVPDDRLAEINVRLDELLAPAA